MRIAYIGNAPPAEQETEDKVYTYFELPRSLTAFVASPVLKDYDHIVFNLCGSTYSQPHIISAIQTIKQYISSELTVVKEDVENTKILFACLQNFNVKNLIAGKDEEDIKKQISDCINGRKSLQYIAKAKVAGALAVNIQTANLVFNVPDNINISIAVIGALPRIGTTTHAFGIYNYCESLGFKPLLVDKTGLHHALQQYEETTIDENNFLEINNIRFDTNEHLNDSAVNLNIFDLGSDIENNATDILAADFVVLVCGTKITEMLPLAGQLQKLTVIEDIRRINIVSFATNKDFEDLTETLSGDSYMATYHPDMWIENNTLYSEVLHARLKSLCANQ